MSHVARAWLLWLQENGDFPEGAIAYRVAESELYKSGFLLISCATVSCGACGISSVKISLGLRLHGGFYPGMKLVPG